MKRAVPSRSIFSSRTPSSTQTEKCVLDGVPFISSSAPMRLEASEGETPTPRAMN